MTGALREQIVRRRATQPGDVPRTMQRVKTLIHVHTDYSFDSNISLDVLADHLRREQIEIVGITDHDTIEGALRLRDRLGETVIVGEEVTTLDGHLIGLFIERHVEPGRPARETAESIREQGGLVLVPHPFVGAFGCGLRDVCDDIVDLIDAVEVFNSQNLSDAADAKAVRFAELHGLTTFVGADSHMRTSISPTFQLMPKATSPAAFLRSLEYAEFVTRRHPPAFFAATAYRLARHYAGLRLPAGFGANHAPRRNGSKKLRPRRNIASV